MVTTKVFYEGASELIFVFDLVNYRVFQIVIFLQYIDLTLIFFVRLISVIHRHFLAAKFIYRDENEKKISKVVVLAVVSVALSGCVGSNAVTGYLMKFNVKAVDNR